MTFSRRLPIVRFAMVLVFATFLLIGGKALSQTGQESGSGLSISPTRTELLNMAPGGTDTVRLSIRNVTNGTIIARPVVNDFESDNETERPKLILQPRDDLPSIRPFLSNLEDIRLAPGESKSVEIPVSIPSDTAPGGYYGIVRYIAVPEGSATPDAGQVSLTASVASIVLIEIPGDVQEQVQVRDVSAYRKGVAGTFFGAKPEEIGVRVQNQGNGFVKPFGTVTITNPMGKEAHRYELNTPFGDNPRSNILPKSSRVFKDPVQGVSTPGRYVITASVSFGNGGEVLTVRRAFWYLPIWFIVILVLTLILIGLAIYWIQKRVRGGRSKKTKR